MIELIGWVSSILFAICALPQAWACYKQGHGNGISKLFVWFWLLGELLVQVYVYNTHGLDLPLFLNYWGNSILIVFIMRYIYFPRSDNAS
jgi:uncharacterized protein with PQ loop repeat